MNQTKICHNNDKKIDCNNCGIGCKDVDCDFSYCERIETHNPYHLNIVCSCPNTSCRCMSRYPDEKDMINKTVEIFSKVY